eukprot:5935657-Prymnesium_polylepis.1
MIIQMRRGAIGLEFIRRWTVRAPFVLGSRTLHASPANPLPFAHRLAIEIPCAMLCAQACDNAIT